MKFFPAIEIPQIAVVISLFLISAFGWNSARARIAVHWGPGGQRPNTVIHPNARRGPVPIAKLLALAVLVDMPATANFVWPVLATARTRTITPGSLSS